MFNYTKFNRGAWFALWVLPLVAYGSHFRFFEPVQPPRSVQVMAHRGASGQAPENTRPALRRCFDDGFEWAEIDVRLTHDGHHVLWHDGALDKLGLPGQQVSNLTLEELRRIDAGSWFAKRYQGEALLTLRDALEFAKGKLNLYLDCKQVNLELLAQEIRGAGMEHQVIVYENPEWLQALRALVTDKISVMSKWHPKDGFDGWVESLKPDAVELDANEITPAIVAEFHGRGIKVEVKVLGDWDQPEFWDLAIKAGVDWLQTDLAEEIIARDFQQRTPQRPCLVSFHRGANRYAPENTLPAFAKAGRLGADYVEFDVHTSRDGQCFLLHDSRLDRTTNGKGPLAEQTAEELVKLNAGGWFGRPYAALPLPTLDDFLAAVPPDLQLYFDAKAITPEALSAAVESHQLAERTIVYQSADYLLKLKAINPRIRALPPLGRPEQIDSLAERLQPYAVDARWNILSKELIDHCHALGIKVFSDALGSNEKIQSYQQAMDWGIDLIQTDFPLRVYRAMELRAH
jgi:glycerophosphoryl diester phosphodiesterase